MAVVLDLYGTQWSVRRKWWPFPDVFDIVDLASRHGCSADDSTWISRPLDGPDGRVLPETVG